MNDQKGEKIIRKIVADALELALVTARDDGLLRPEAEALLWRVFRVPPGTPLPPRTD